MRLSRILSLTAALSLSQIACAWAEDVFEEKPILAEDFSQGVDRNIWFIKEHSSHGHEEEYFTADNIKTDKNGLHIVAERKQTIAHWRPDQPYEYTSGTISTKQKFLYGRFEIVAKMPKGQGFLASLVVMRLG